MEKTLTLSEQRQARALAIALLALLSLLALSNSPAVEDNQFLLAEQRHESIAQLVAQFVRKEHYNHVAVDDELSSQVLDFYIENLDRNRMYLLVSDIEYF